MKTIRKTLLAFAVVTIFSAFSLNEQPKVDWDMVAKIREEGFQRSQVMDIVGYMTDVLGARLTLSEDMKRAQAWAKDNRIIGVRHRILAGFSGFPDS